MGDLSPASLPPGARGWPLRVEYADLFLAHVAAARGAFEHFFTRVTKLLAQIRLVAPGSAEGAGLERLMDDYVPDGTVKAHLRETAQDDSAWDIHTLSQILQHSDWLKKYLLPELGLEEGTPDYTAFRDLAEKVFAGRQMMKTTPSQSQTLSWLSDIHELIRLSQGLAGSGLLGSLGAEQNAALVAVASARSELWGLGNVEADIEVKQPQVQMLLLLWLALKEVEHTLVPHIQTLISNDVSWPAIKKIPVADCQGLHRYLENLREKQQHQPTMAPVSPRLNGEELECLRTARNAFHHGNESRTPKNVRDWLKGIKSLMDLFSGSEETCIAATEHAAAMEHLDSLVGWANQMMAHAAEGDGGSDFSITVRARPTSHGMRIPAQAMDHPLVGRHDVIDDLVASMTAATASSAGCQRCFLLHGKPGTGKTATARAIAKKLEIALPIGTLHYWLDGGSLAGLRASLVRMGHAVVPWLLSDNSDDQDVLKMVKAYLESRNDWFLVVDNIHSHPPRGTVVMDNVDSRLQLLRDLLPANRGIVLLTAHELQDPTLLQDPASCKKLEALDKDLSVKLIREILKAARGEQRKAYHADQLSRVMNSDNPERLGVFLGSNLVDNLPLVITTFGQFLWTKLSPLRKLGGLVGEPVDCSKLDTVKLEKVEPLLQEGDFLCDVRRDLAKLLDVLHNSSGAQVVESALLTLQSSLRMAEQQLLRHVISGFKTQAESNLDNLPVDKKYLRGPLGCVKLWRWQLEADNNESGESIEFMQMCSRILGCMALLYEEAVPMALLHEVVPPQEQETLESMERAVDALCRTPLVEATSGEDHRCLQMHGLFQLAVQQAFPEECQWASNNMLDALSGRFDGSCPTWEEALEVSGWVPGILRWNGLLKSTGSIVARSDEAATKLARVRLSVGGMLAEKLQVDWSIAEDMLKDALEALKARCGPRHLETAAAMQGLANLYQRQRNFDKAEQLYGEDLAIRKENGDGDANRLAIMLKHQRRFAEAEPLFCLAVAIREEKHGENHVMPSYPLKNLADVLSSQGRLAEAKTLYRRVLAIREEQLGANHLDTARCLNSLAICLSKMSDHEQAEELHRRALDIRDEQLGDHVETAASLNNLANLYNYNQGCYDKAEPLYQRALAIREKLLGDHVETAASLNNLANLYNYNQGCYDKAEPLYQRALAIRRKKLGRDHRDTVATRKKLDRLINMRKKKT